MSAVVPDVVATSHALLSSSTESSQPLRDPLGRFFAPERVPHPLLGGPRLPPFVEGQGEQDAEDHHGRLRQPSGRPRRMAAAAAR